MASIEEKIRRVKSMDSGGVVELLKKERIMQAAQVSTTKEFIVEEFFYTKPVVAACSDLSRFNQAVCEFFSQNMGYFLLIFDPAFHVIRGESQVM